MTSLRSDALTVLAAEDEAAPRLNPFLHLGADRVYDPLGDRLITAGEPGFAALMALLGGRPVAELAGPELDRLLAGGWLLPAEVDPARRFLLKYVSLEAHTVCNQSCYFCPVSVSPREAHFMPMELYRRICRQLTPFRETLEAVYMISYNEPTADKRFIEQVRALLDAGLPPATLTNGTGLTPRRIDELVEMGGLRFLSINLSTLDSERYRQDRGAAHVDRVLRNLDYAKDRPVAEQMNIVVLGVGDEVHRRDFEAIRDRFAGSRFDVEHFVVNDRAGYLQIGLTGPGKGARLGGCEHQGSRPLQHLHVNPYGQCILCCQDYDETVVVGDLNESSVYEVLTGPEMARARRMVYGLEEAPDDFICRNCRFAILR